SCKTKTASIKSPKSRQTTQPNQNTLKSSHISLLPNIPKKKCGETTTVDKITTTSNGLIDVELKFNGIPIGYGRILSKTSTSAAIMITEWKSDRVKLLNESVYKNKKIPEIGDQVY